MKIIIAISVLANLLLVWQVWAGPVDSPAPPNTTSSYTLEDLYNRLDTGVGGMQRGFTEPSVGPGTGTMHTLNEIMAVAPAQDPVNGASPGQVLTGRTFWGLGTGARWGTYVGTRPISPLPKTGQTTTLGSGDDGDLQAGEAWPNPRFTDNGDGTVTDNLTGLVWLRNANCFGTNTFSAARGVSGNLEAGYCGLTDGSIPGDWRLPNVRELHSLVDYEQFNPVLPLGHPFIAIQVNEQYWSSTRRISNLGYAWTLDMQEGYFDTHAIFGSQYYVWPVRGGS